MHDGGIVPQLQSKEFGGNFTGDVISRRSETAGDENKVRIRERLCKRIADSETVRHRHLPADAQAERKYFAGDKAEMRIENVAEQKLGAGVDDDDVHVEALKRSNRRFNDSTF
jgi:hypothetical protein